MPTEVRFYSRMERQISLFIIRLSTFSCHISTFLCNQSIRRQMDRPLANQNAFFLLSWVINPLNKPEILLEILFHQGVIVPDFIRSEKQNVRYYDYVFIAL